MTARIQQNDSQPGRASRSLPRARLTNVLEEPLEVGAGTAIRLQGRLQADAPLSALRVRLRGIEMDVDGLVQDPETNRVAWWVVMPVPPGAACGRHEVELVLDDGRAVELGTVVFAESPDSPPQPAIAPPGGDRPLIAICMATYEPDYGWLVRQLDSIRPQTWERWICLISDDGSSPEAFAGLLRAVGDDPRFVVSRASERHGFYANFERALRMVPPQADLIALADQDDRWDPDKLEALHATLAGHPLAALAYSDMRIVAADGEVLSDTFWYQASNACDDIASLMVNNTVTGAASLFRRDLLEIALPFPPRQSSDQYHDHWLALCALATGEIAYLDRPTYDYTRHADSVTVRATEHWFAPPRTLRERGRIHRLRWTNRLRLGSTPRGWRGVYFDRYLLIRQLVAVLDLRFGAEMDAGKRRQLRLLAEAEGSPKATAWLLARTLRPLIGRGETLGRERVLFGALLWRWSMAAAARLRRS